MSFEDGIESGSKGSGPTDQSALDKAVQDGEYDPAFLSQFPQWKTMSRHRQLQYIREGLENRERQIISQWAEINNILNFSKKPHLQQALRNLEEQLRKLKNDKEELFVEYSR